MDAQQEPRWLDAEEAQAWRALAITMARLPAALDAQLRRDAGISHFEYQVLALLSEAPGRTLRMSALAAQAEGSLPRLSQVVARLEQRGWVRRTPDPADGRYTLATLTDVEFMAEVIAVALEEGATTINVPDTVGYTMPREYAAMFDELYRLLPAVVTVAYCAPPAVTSFTAAPIPSRLLWWPTSLRVIQ